MGESYLQGVTPGAAPNVSAAVEEFEQAAEEGHSEALARLGILKIQGFEGSDPDPQVRVFVATGRAGWLE